MPCLNLSDFLRRCQRALLALVLLCSLPARAQWLDATALFDWAEATYPSVFAGHPADQTVAPYTFRHYPDTQNYLGVSEGVVYVLGPVSGQTLLRVDTLAAFQCLVYPQRCSAEVADIAATPLRYGETVTFTLSGSALDGLTLSLNKCANPRQVASVDTRTRNISCTVSGTGALTVTASRPAGTVLLSRSFTVPTPQVQLQTSLGNVLLELHPGAAPLSVNNFLAHVKSGFYTGTLFHRVVPGFVVQGGGFNPGPSYKTPPYAPIRLESNNGLSNLRGTLAMARTSAADSATSQFYVNLVNNTGLDYASASAPGYAVFGTVAQGMDVIDQMAAQPTATVGGLQNVPRTDILILRAQQVQ
jgi:cyclophilin family peptidyl-prolyl cis-trans isomerase